MYEKIDTGTYLLELGQMYSGLKNGPFSIVAVHGPSMPGGDRSVPAEVLIMNIEAETPQGVTRHFLDFEGNLWRVEGTATATAQNPVSVQTA